MGERLSGGNVAIALLANTIATGSALVTLILTFGPVSGAHFNPPVTLADASQRGLVKRSAGISIRSGAWRLRGWCLCPLDVWTSPLLRSKSCSQRELAGL